jgi:hypothetical protein
MKFQIADPGFQNAELSGEIIGNREFGSWSLGFGICTQKICVHNGFSLNNEWIAAVLRDKR